MRHNSAGTREQPRDPLVEVLSPCNRATVLLRKLRACRAMPSLTGILLIQRDAHRIEHRTGAERGSWARAEPLSGPVLTRPRLGAAWRLEERSGDD